MSSSTLVISWGLITLRRIGLTFSGLIANAGCASSTAKPNDAIKEEISEKREKMKFIGYVTKAVGKTREQDDIFLSNVRYISEMGALEELPEFQLGASTVGWWWPRIADWLQQG